jgi:hypothetical protein
MDGRQRQQREGTPPVVASRLQRREGRGGGSAAGADGRTDHAGDALFWAEHIFGPAGQVLALASRRRRHARRRGTVRDPRHAWVAFRPRTDGDGTKERIVRFRGAAACEAGCKRGRMTGWARAGGVRPRSVGRVRCPQAGDGAGTA